MICKTAVANGETVNTKHNCNLPGDGPWTFDDNSLARTCEERYQLARRHRYTFSAMERFLLQGELDCPDRFMYIIMVRDPADRAASHADVHRFGPGQDKHERRPPSKFYRFTRKGKQRGNKKPKQRRRRLRLVLHTDKRHRRGARERRKKQKRPKSLYGQALMDNRHSDDNYLTRILLGEKGFNGTIPFGSINESHAEEAKRQLDRFDHILRLDYFNVDSAQLQKALGWTNWIGVANARSPILEGKSEEKNGFEDANRSAFKQSNSIDGEVYEYACTLAQRLTDDAKDELDTIIR